MLHYVKSQKHKRWCDLVWSIHLSWLSIASNALSNGWFDLELSSKLQDGFCSSLQLHFSFQEEKIRRKLRAKLETAKLIQAAMEEMALYKQKKSDDKYAGIAVEFAEFIKKVSAKHHNLFLCSCVHMCVQRVYLYRCMSLCRHSAQTFFILCLLYS